MTQPRYAAIARARRGMATPVTGRCACAAAIASKGTIVDALIGYTGFVGGCLSGQHAFDQYINRSNIDAMAGLHFDMVVCAAAPGSMFEANRDPERDAAQISQLIDQLGQIGARRFVLISTIAVLADFRAADEDTVDYETRLAYGCNRRLLERQVADRFQDTLIVRLPALFGPGLKKNFLFDILNPLPSMLPPARLEALMAMLGAEDAKVLARLYGHDDALGMMVLDRAALQVSGRRPALEDAVDATGFSAINFTNPDSVFQFYDMSRLWHDIALGLAHDLRVLHLAPPPLTAGTVYRAITGTAMPATGARLHQEDMRTAHAGLWGHQGEYMTTPDALLSTLTRFVAEYRSMA